MHVYHYRLSSLMLSVVSVRMIKMKSSCSVVISNKGSQWGYCEEWLPSWVAPWYTFTPPGMSTLQIKPLSDAFYSTSSLATSFMKNREAGVVLSSACSGSINYYSSIFESDWNEGLQYTVNNHYNSSGMNAITDPSPMPLMSPPTLHLWSICDIPLTHLLA